MQNKFFIKIFLVLQLFIYDCQSMDLNKSGTKKTLVKDGIKGKISEDEKKEPAEGDIIKFLVKRWGLETKKSSSTEAKKQIAVYAPKDSKLSALKLKIKTNDDTFMKEDDTFMDGDDVIEKTYEDAVIAKTVVDSNEGILFIKGRNDVAEEITPMQKFIKKWGETKRVEAAKAVIPDAKCYAKAC